MRLILSIACILGLAGCVASNPFKMGPLLIAAPDPSQLVVTAPMLQAAASEANYPTIDIVFSRYPRGSSDTLTLRTYSIQYFTMANVAIPMTDVPLRSIPTPVTVAPPAPDVPSEARFSLSILTQAIITYLKDQPAPMTINARVKFDGERGAGDPLQLTFNVPIQLLAGPASPTP